MRNRKQKYDRKRKRQRNNFFLYHHNKNSRNKLELKIWLRFFFFSFLFGAFEWINSRLLVKWLQLNSFLIRWLFDFYSTVTGLLGVRERYRPLSQTADAMHKADSTAEERLNGNDVNSLRFTNLIGPKDMAAVEDLQTSFYNYWLWLGASTTWGVGSLAMDQWGHSKWEMFHSEISSWKLSPVVFYHWIRLRNTTGLSFQLDNCEVNGAAVAGLVNVVCWKNAGENKGRISSSSVEETRKGTRQIPHPSSNHDAADATDALEIDVTRDVY